MTQNVRSLGFDLDDLVQPEEDLPGLRADRAQRDRGDGRIRPGRALRPARLRHRLDRGQARCAGHDRVLVQRPAAMTAILRAELGGFPLAQRQGRHGDHHRRAGRGHPYTAWAGGIRLRLRDPARSPRDRATLHPAAADRQVPRLGPRHQRVSVPDRRAGDFRPAGHLAGPAGMRFPASGSPRASPAWTPCSRAKGFYRGTAFSCRAPRARGKTSLAAHFRRCGLPRRRNVPVLRLRGVARPAGPQHAVDRHRPGAVDRQGPACCSMPPGPRFSGWRCT